MGMGAPNKGGGGMIAEINVTPLVDVMLVLLIIFMITATLMKTEEEEDRQQREVELELPVTRQNPNTIDIENTDKLILQIDENLRIYLGEELITDCVAALTNPAADRFEVCFDEVQLKLGQNVRLQNEGEVYILADTGIPYGFVVGTLHRIRLAGVHKVGMVTNPEYLTPEEGG